MKLLRLLALCGTLLSTSVFAAEGVIKVKSQHSVAQSLDKLTELLTTKGMTVFSRIDHQAGAIKAGSTLRDTSLLLFGNPRVGTPLMQCQQTIAIDLPQKMLAWQDEQGQVWLGYNDPLYLGKRHGIDMDSPCYAVLEKISTALANFTQAASQ